MVDKSIAFETEARALSQLRHLYELMIAGRVTDTDEAARGLLGPSIARLEEAQRNRSVALADKLREAGRPDFEAKARTVGTPGCSDWLLSRIAAELRDVDARARAEAVAEDVCEMAAKLQEARELGKAAGYRRGVEAAMGMGEAWPLPDLLERLAGAVEHLMHDHDCDAHGWEERDGASMRAREHAKRLRALLPPEPAKAQSEPARCQITGNPCGTDTRFSGHPCQCGSCVAHAGGAPEPAKAECMCSTYWDILNRTVDPSCPTHGARR